MSQAPKFASIAVESLRFDPLNPRLPESVSTTDIPDVLRFMLEDAGLLDLMGSIAKQGFFPGEPLLVSPVDATTWCVVEGNRRFASSLLLSHPELAPSRKKQVAELAAEAAASQHDLSSLPCLVFAARGEILDHLGYRHVTGIKEWEPLAKARFLAQRFAGESGATEARFKSLAKSIGSRADYVGRLLTAFALYKVIESRHFFNVKGLDASSIEFSLLTSLLAYTNVVSYLGLTSSQDLEQEDLQVDRLEFLTRIAFERISGKTRLGESRNIRTLADVLSSPRALEALEQGVPLLTASQYTEAGAQAFRTWIGSAQQSLDLAFDVLKEAAVNREDVEQIIGVRDTAATLAAAAAAQIDGDG